MVGTVPSNLVLSLPPAYQGNSRIRIYDQSGRKELDKALASRDRKEIVLTKHFDNCAYVAELIAGKTKDVRRFLVLH